MKLSANDTSNLETILDTCISFDIDSIIIGEGLIRGVNAAKTCAIISDVNVPSLPQTLGISRLKDLNSRLAVFKALKDTTIDAKESDRGEISSLTISAGRNKVQFRCTSSMLIKAPKQINDDVLGIVKFSSDESKMILNAIKVMDCKQVVIAAKADKSVVVEMMDSNNDAFKIDIESQFESDSSTSSVTYYSPSVLKPILQISAVEDRVLEIILGENGTLVTTVNGHAITILPLVGDGDDE